jgi:hypothetical protein
MSRRVGLRLVPERAVDEAEDEGAGSAAGLGSDSGGRALAVTVRRDGAGSTGAVSVDREVRDRGRGPAERALGIATQPDFAEAHAERVVRQKPTDQRLADTE